MSSSEEIKNKLDIVEVIKEYVQLKPAGANFQARCPFHNEKSPSFVVSPQKQIWHCFGCGKGGDVISFVMEAENLTFIEALRFLAPRAGVIIESYNKRESSEKNRLLDVMELASSYYYNSLINKKLGESGLAYIENRGLNPDTIQDWKIGFSSDSWDDLILFLKSKGFNEQDILKAGLSIKKEGTNRFYNRFRNRIMFPIRDIGGNVVAFTARILPDAEGSDRMGKYINSPQTLIFDKSTIVFGLDKAKQAIKNEDRVVLVEGQMDCITAHQNGFKNVVASSGTAITAGHIKLLSRYTNNFIFALDADSAGQNAIERGEKAIFNFDEKIVEGFDRYGRIKKYIDPQYSYNINIKVIEMPDGEDPDSFIKKNKDAWRYLVENAKPIMQYYFDRVFKNLDLNDIENKKKAVKILLPILARVNDKIEREYWLKKLSENVDTKIIFLQETLEQLLKNNLIKKSENVLNKEKNIKKENNNSKDHILSENLLALILKFNNYLSFCLDFLNIEYLTGEENKTIYRNLLIYYNRYKEADGSLFLDNFSKWLEENDYKNEINILNKLFVLSEKNFYNYSESEAYKELIKLANFLKKNYLQKRLEEITKAIDKLEKNPNEEDYNMEDLLKEFNNLLIEIKNLDV